MKPYNCVHNYQVSHTVLFVFVVSFSAIMLRNMCILLSVVYTNVHAQVPRNCGKGPDGFQRPAVMAHRGLPGYELEHDYIGYDAAIAVGAQYIEFDVTMTKDDQLIIVHDTYLDSEYNSSKVFPNLAKRLSLVPALDGDPINFPDKKVWQHNLTYDQILKSSMCKDYDGYKKTYPGRKVIFSENGIVGEGAERCLKPLRVIDATPKLEATRIQREKDGKSPFGLVVELKRPRFYEALGKDMPTPLAKALTKFTGHVIIQCFEPLYLQKMKEQEKKLTDDGTKAAGSPPWVYMLLTVDEQSFKGLNYPETKTGDFKDSMYTRAEALDIAVPDDVTKFDAYMSKISKYATIFAPWKRSLQPLTTFSLTRQEEFQTEAGQQRGRALIESARKHGLETAPYTFRSDVNKLPRIYDGNAQAELKHYFELGVTGVFTDFANVAVRAATDYCTTTTKPNLRVSGGVDSYLTRLPTLLALLWTLVSDLL